MRKQSVFTKALALFTTLAMLCTVTAFAEPLSGQADGYCGPITAQVTVENGKITDLTITGDAETAEIGGAALEPLKEAILAAGTVDGVDGISGATWTSKGVFAAIRNAMGVEEQAEAAQVQDVTADTLYHGIGVVCTPRLGPGADAEGVGVYSFNEVAAYVIVDGDKRIVDLEVDIMEIITPNHDESNDADNFLAGWPGQSYNSDADGDGVVDGQLEETEDIFTSEIAQWLTKRQKGADYKMNSGTWEQEMDIFEQFFIGKTVDELNAWFAANCSDLNGRPLTAVSTKDEDVAKFAALSDEGKLVNDAVSGATMSVQDPHGDILGAIAKAVENAVPMTNVTSIAKIGLGITAVPRLGPGSDDQGVPCYSFNTAVAGVAYDADDKMVALLNDVVEIITPNHDGADDNAFTGWPGQSYNADIDADGKVDEVWEQTEETFTAQISAYQTKRSLGDKYKMNSGTWVDEMAAYESVMVGMTAEEANAWFTSSFSDVNGRALHGTSDKEDDVAKVATMTDDQKAVLDGISSATMSLKDAHGDIIGAIAQAFQTAKPTSITVK